MNSFQPVPVAWPVGMLLFAVTPAGIVDDFSTTQDYINTDDSYNIQCYMYLALNQFSNIFSIIHYRSWHTGELC